MSTFTLSLPTETELESATTSVVTEEQISATEKKASEIVRSLLSIDLTQAENKARSVATIDAIGLQQQKKSSELSTMLKEPIARLAHSSEDGSAVAQSLIDLKMQVEALDPSELNLDPGWFSRLVGLIPGVGSPLKRYFSKYESSQTIIQAIINSLEGGKNQLTRDNTTLKEDQARMRLLTEKLYAALELAQSVDEALENAIEEGTSSIEQTKFIQEELLFPLRQRIMDLQQQCAVNQQAVLAIEIIIRNNKELIRGVNRSLSVTVNALEVGVTVALALANQKIVLDKITALNTTTSNLLAGTAARLKTQATEINQNASSAQLETDKLKQAFHDISAALEEIGRFRTESLPRMAKSIEELNTLSGEAEKAITRHEQSDKLDPIIPVEFE